MTGVVEVLAQGVVGGGRRLVVPSHPDLSGRTWFLVTGGICRSGGRLLDSLGHRGREGERFAPPPPVAHGGRVLGIRTVSSALCHPNGMPGSRKPAWKREMQDALFNPNPCDSDGDAWEGVLDLQAGGAMPSDAEVLKHLGVPMTRGRDAGNILKRGRRV